MYKSLQCLKINFDPSEKHPQSSNFVNPLLQSGHHQILATHKYSMLIHTIAGFSKLATAFHHHHDVPISIYSPNVGVGLL